LKPDAHFHCAAAHKVNSHLCNLAARRFDLQRIDEHIIASLCQELTRCFAIFIFSVKISTGRDHGDHTRHWFLRRSQKARSSAVAITGCHICSSSEKQYRALIATRQNRIVQQTLIQPASSVDVGAGNCRDTLRS
jgi:hypothetical protein